MRVLVIADSVIPVPPAGYGGVERVLHDLVTELAGRGYQITLLAGPGSKSPGELFTYTDARDRYKLARGVAKWRFRRLLAGFLDRHDVVHSAARLDYILPALRHPIPKLLNLQNPISTEQVDYVLKHSRGRAVFVPCGKKMAEPHLGRGVWRPIHNCTDVSRYPFSPQAEEPAYLGFLGRITPYKGLDEAMHVARAAGLPLVIGGNFGTAPGDREYFDREIAPQIDGRAVRYLGEVNDAAKAKLLGGARALLNPIRWDEPFGIVMVEALACGTPVIATARGEVPFIIEHGKTGYLCSSREEMLRAVAEVARLDRRACRAAAEAHFQPAAMVDKCVEVYQWLRSAAAAAPSHWDMP
jgi:glycosyltransferase involved in cell wall biosynthesis